MPREVHGMLAGAAADLQHLQPVREAAAQDCENRLLISLAGFGTGQHGFL